LRIPWPAWFGSLGIHLAVILAFGVAAWVFWPAAEPRREPPQLTMLPAQPASPADELPPLLEPVDAVPPDQVDAELQEAQVAWDQFRESVPSPVAQWPVRADWLNDPSAYARPRRAQQQSQPREAAEEPSASAQPSQPMPQQQASAPHVPQPALAGASDPEPREEACPAPTYPLAARRRGMEGVVILLVEVSSAGMVLRSRVLESSGHGVLDRAALDGVEAWRFTPARDASGQQIAGSARVPIRFRIHEAGGK